MRLRRPLPVPGSAVSDRTAKVDERRCRPSGSLLEGGRGRRLAEAGSGRSFGCQIQPGRCVSQCDLGREILLHTQWSCGLARDVRGRPAAPDTRRGAFHGRRRRVLVAVARRSPRNSSARVAAASQRLAGSFSSCFGRPPAGSSSTAPMSASYRSGRFVRSVVRRRWCFRMWVRR